MAMVRMRMSYTNVCMFDTNVCVHVGMMYTHKKNKNKHVDMMYEYTRRRWTQSKRLQRMAMICMHMDVCMHNMYLYSHTHANKVK